MADAEKDEKLRREFIPDGNLVSFDKIYGPVAVLEQPANIEKYKLEQAILERLNVHGGPTSVTEWFVESTSDIDPNEVLYNLIQD